MFRRCRYVTKPCNLGLLATCSGKHAYKKTETSLPFGPFVKETSHHFTRISEAPLSPSPWCLAGSLPHNLRRLSLSPLSSTGPFSRTSFFHAILGARGRRHGRQPLNPGAGPAPVALPEAFGGNRRLYTAAPPAADPPRVDSCSPPVHDYTCNLQCILRVVFKKHRFLQGFVAFAVSRFHLGDVKKPWVFHGFGSAAGVRNGQLAVLTALVPT